VTKAITAAFGLQKLGPEYYFETWLHVVSLVFDGLLRGDLIFIGSADSTLPTDDLVRFAKALYKTGIRRVERRLLIVDDGFAYLREIDDN
jgi:D-alanyl-D-alanine carboxypeptidase/D-alanyl-D-alanine-endopeptidase (penicillin-binding protein 4)